MSHDAGHTHGPTHLFVTGCPLCDAAKAVRDRALAHLGEALLLLSKIQPVDPSEDPRPTIRLNLAPIGLTGDDHNNCYGADLTAKQAEALADAVDSLSAYRMSELPIPFLPADTDETPAQSGGPTGEQVGSGEWSAAAVAQNNPDLYADVTDLFMLVDPQSYLDDVFASPDPHESLNAYEQLVTGEWDGDL